MFKTVAYLIQLNMNVKKMPSSSSLTQLFI